MERNGAGSPDSICTVSPGITPKIFLKCVLKKEGYLSASFCMEAANWVVSMAKSALSKRWISSGAPAGDESSPGPTQANKKQQTGNIFVSRLNFTRSKERRVGKERVSKVRSRRWP